MDRSPVERIILDNSRRRQERSFDSPSAGGIGGGGRDDTARLDIAVMAQRLTSLEDRMLSLEQLVTKTLSKVDQLAEHQESDNRNQQALLCSARENTTLIQREGVERVVQMENHFSQILERQSIEMEEMRSAMRGMERKIAENEANSKQVALENRLSQVHGDLNNIVHQNKATLANAMRTMQVYVRRQVDSVAAESISRVEQFETDRRLLFEANAGIKEEVTLVRDDISGLRGLHDSLEKTVRQQDSTLGRTDEDVKALSRRVMSALRHLAHDPVASLAINGSSGAPSPAMPAVQGRAQPMGGTVSPARNYSTVGAGVGGDGSADEVDMFIRELGHMTKSSTA